MCATMIIKNGKPRFIALAGALTLAALVSAQAARGDGNKDKPCSDGTVKGEYGIQMQGTRPAPPSGAIESVIGVVWRSYDGHGNFDQVDNVKGSITGIVPDRPGTGTYQVNTDCTMSAYFQPDPSNPNLFIEEKLVIVNSGDEIRGMTLSPPPLMVTSVSKRIGKH